MGIFVNIYYISTASAIYPGADLPTTVIFGLILNLLIGYVYWMLATAMPRTGGDYVYVSRIFHPALGFMANLMFVTIVSSWIGVYPPLSSTQGFYTMLVNLSTVTGNPAFANSAPWFATQAAQFIVGGIIVAITMMIMFLPVRWIFRIVAGIFFVQLAIVVWFVAALLPISHAQFLSAFNSKFGVTAEQLINVAQNNAGVSYNITFGATMIGVVYTMLSYIGYANSSYFAGELKGNPKSSQGLAIMVSPIIFAIMIYFEYFLSYQVFGHDFLVATNTIAGSSNGAIASYWYNFTSAPPTPAYFVSFVSNNPIFVVAVPLGLILTYVGFAIVYMFIPIRQAFAYAFDRIIPTKFAAVNRRGVPWVAVLLLGFIGYVFLYLAVYTSVLSYLGYTNFGWWLAAAIVMFAGAAFPYVRRTKDIFDTSPDIVRKKIAGVPVITIVGVIAGILSLWVSYSAILPSFTGAPMNPVYVAGIMVVFVIALIIYALSYAYHRSKGLPLDLISKELPPV
jgi:amino acid transporter